MRGLDATQLAEIAKLATGAVTLVELDFSGGVARFCSGVRDVEYDGDTYTATGSYGNISAITEDRTVTSPGVKLSLSGIDATILSATIDEEYYNRAVNVFWQFINHGGAPVGDPIVTWSGFMDTMQLSSDVDNMSIELTCESRAIQLKNRPALRTAEAQKTLFSGDTFYDFLSGLEALTISWGGNPISLTGPELPITGGIRKAP